MRLIQSRDNTYVERNGLWLEFADPIDDPRDGLLSFVELDPPNDMLRPEDRRARKFKNFRQLGL